MSGGITGTDMSSYVDIKEGVRFNRFNIHFSNFILAVIRAWDLYAPSVIPVITSAADGKHMEGSLHYKDLAWDLRTRNLEDGRVEEIARMLRVDLGKDWDILVEHSVFKNGVQVKWKHIHVEMDRKGV